MGIKKYKPITPGQRGMTVSTFEEVTKTKPEKSLTKSMSKHTDRNSHGKITKAVTTAWPTGPSRPPSTERFTPPRTPRKAVWAATGI